MKIKIYTPIIFFLNLNYFKQINLTANKGSITVNATTLSSGTHQYLNNFYKLLL